MRAIILVWVACGLAACQRSEVQFVFNADTTTGVTTDLVHVHFTDGYNQRTLDGSDFRITRDYGTPHTPNIDTQGHGTLVARIWLTSGPDTLALGTVELPLREDWGWGVNIFVADSNPIRQCFGCVGSRSFKAAPPLPGDSLFLVWGGNSISHPVIY